MWALATVGTAIAGAVSPPHVTVFEDSNAVWGIAPNPPEKPGLLGKVRFLGNESATPDCIDACTSYAGSDGAKCHAFTYHHLNFTGETFRGFCFAITDHTWAPHPGLGAGITSGRHVAFAVLLRANAGTHAPDGRGHSSPRAPCAAPGSFQAF